MTKSICLLLLVVGLLATGCGKPALFEDQHDLAEGQWQQDEQLSFSFTVPEANVKSALVMHVRAAAAYPYHNLYFRYSLKDEAGTIIAEGLENRNLFDPVTGRPLGTGSGDIKEVSFTLKDDLLLQAGKNYSMDIAQYMRVEYLKGVWSVGISVYKAEEKTQQ